MCDPDLPPGVHTITSTATDSDGLTGMDEILVTIEAVNTAPVVSITSPSDGETFTSGETITFEATVSDAEENNLTPSIEWKSDIVGESIGTGGMFNRNDLPFGNHIISATVTDSGGLTGSTQVTISIPPASTEVVDIQVSADSDDAEERIGGSVTVTSTNLDVVREDLVDPGNQTVGVRFDGVGIPQGANIVDAYIQFRTNEVGAEETALVIHGEANDNATTFAEVGNDISSRPPTTLSVPWMPEPWLTIGEADLAQRTPNLTPIVQEIVNRSGWFSGNALGMIITGDGQRIADSHDGDPSGAPLLHVEYVVMNMPPVVTIDSPADTSVFTEGENITFTGSAMDAEDGNITNSIVWESDLDGETLGTGGTFVRDDLSIGDHTITATITDSENLSLSVTVAIAVVAPDTELLSVQVSAKSDDAEEKASGAMSTTSRDLDLIREAVFDPGNQTAGIRFNDIDIPKGANILKAHIQFQADQADSEPTSLFIQGEASNNARSFRNTREDITLRPRTVSSVSWIPDPWITAGEAGPAQLTPDISGVVQEIINRPGWESGNSAAFLLDGTGRRRAESFEGAPSGAPLLEIEYNVTNEPPTVMVTLPVDRDAFSQGETITFTGTGTDKEDGNLGPNIEWSSDIVGASIGTGGTIMRDDLQVGLHTITATVQDSGGLIDSEQITITVFPSGGQVLEAQVSANSDDAEERSNGEVSATSTDLDMINDPRGGAGDQTVGLRYTNITIPQGAIITSAHIQFEADERGSELTGLFISGQASDNAETFLQLANNITSRPRTLSSISWNPDPWKVVNEVGAAQRTPDIAAILQEIVNRPGWSSGNDAAFFVDGAGRRTAISHDKDPSGAPLLHVEYVVTNLPPEVSINSIEDGSIFVQGDTISFMGTANDQENGDLSDAMDWSSDLVGESIGTGEAFTRNDLPIGVHTITASIMDDEGLFGFDQKTVTITGGNGVQVALIPINRSSDDAEERASGEEKFKSPDLEMSRPGRGEGTGEDQLVGLRFNKVGIAPGSTIFDAHIQFTADEKKSEQTALIIRGEATDDAVRFSKTVNNISSRPQTTASALWSPDPWTTIGESGTAQQSTNIKDIIQEIIDRPGWFKNNSMAFMVIGRGNRTAVSYDGNPSSAPMLYIEYSAVNTPPTVLIDSPIDGRNFTEDDSITFRATSDDDENDNITSTIEWTSDIFGGTIGTGGVISRDDLPPGVHTITATAVDNGDLSGSAQITITITRSGEAEIVESRIRASSDDAEERRLGDLRRGSTDLEMSFGNEGEGGNQLAGLRFTKLSIPKDAVILTAYIQFKADEKKSAPANLVIQGEASGNATKFRSSNENISSRPRTTASVPWTPAPWQTIGEAGLAQQTSSIQDIIQEIVNRDDWSPGNALVIMIEQGAGKGKRTAVSYDGAPSGAPLLHIEYGMGTLSPDAGGRDF